MWENVSILVVLDDALVRMSSLKDHAMQIRVSILVVLDDALVHENGNEDKTKQH